MGLKAIETRFDGYRFRSRLEARWAYYFSISGIVYEYEKEGFDLDGLWYLPDFYLPGLGMWLEIKGMMPEIEEFTKMDRLAKASQRPVICSVGAIGQQAVSVFMPDRPQGTPPLTAWFMPCFACMSLVVMVEQLEGDRVDLFCDWEECRKKRRMHMTRKQAEAYRDASEKTMANTLGYARAYRFDQNQ